MAARARPAATAASPAVILRAMWSVQAPRSGRGLIMGEAKVLVNCHWFDGRSPDVRRDQYVVVRDGNIAGIGPAAAAGAAEDAAVVDLHGSYLMVGLFNMPTHFGLALPGPLGDSIQAMPLHELAFYVAGCARETLLSGVTTVRCVGESKGTDFALRSAIAAGHTAGPRIDRK